MTVVIHTDREAPPGSPALVRDALLRDSNGGVGFLYDFGHRYGWPSGVAPVDGDVVPDISETADGAVDIFSGQAVSLIGGGMAFNSVTSKPVEVTIPANFAADIWDGGEGDQHFLVCVYLRLLTESDWPATGTRPVICWTATSQGYVGPEVDLLTMGFWTSGGNDYLTSRRQLDGGTDVDTRFFNISGHYGRIGQLAFWRNGSGARLRWRDSLGVLSDSRADEGNNTGDFSAKLGHLGVTQSLWGLSNPDQHANTNFRIFRAFGENVAKSGRDPEEVADVDYERNIGRFS